MASTDIKICGLSTPDSITAAARAGASHIGFVFFEKSPRNLDPRQAALLAPAVPDPLQVVGVFVDPDDMLLESAITAGRLKAVQLHGKESPTRIAEIRGRFGLPVWKAVSVKTAADLSEAARFASAADRILFDAKPPQGADLPGGLGVRFDWTLLQNHRPSGPWALSGGLSPANVAGAIRMTGAPMVDASSGIESAPGIKDVDKIAAFCQAVRSL